MHRWMQLRQTLVQPLVVVRMVPQTWTRLCSAWRLTAHSNRAGGEPRGRHCDVFLVAP